MITGEILPNRLYADNSPQAMGHIKPTLDLRAHSDFRPEDNEVNNGEEFGQKSDPLHIEKVGDPVNNDGLAPGVEEELNHLLEAQIPGIISLNVHFDLFKHRWPKRYGSEGKDPLHHLGEGFHLFPGLIPFPPDDGGRNKGEEDLKEDPHQNSDP